MSRLTIKKSHVHGTVKVPPSKSQTLRAILFASMAEGTSYIYRYLNSPDTQAMIKACRLLGATIDEVTLGHLKVVGNGGNLTGIEGVVDAGNSGIVLRFISAVAALGSLTLTITGDRSIQTQRVMTPLLDALGQLGVKAVSEKDNGMAPLIIKGPLKSGKVVVDGQDSQPVSALLIAASLSQAGPFELIVENAGELPWIALTLDWLDRLGLSYEMRGRDHYYIPGRGRIAPFSYTVPGDFSSASFPIAAAVITNSSLTVTNIDPLDSQGDKKFIDVLKTMGANITMQDDRIQVNPGATLQSVTVDINDFIDAISILSVVCCYAEGTSEITNAAIARTKECNRIVCTVKELNKMGAKVTETADGLKITGGALQGGDVLSHHDHRMAMSLAVAALGAERVTIVDGVDCIAKTYPTFIDDFRAIGADFTLKSAPRALILCGPPKSGKTTLGKKVAEELGWKFIDTDELIVAKTGRSCREIYMEEGEEAFRQIEKEVISTLTIHEPTIVAVGGGSLSEESNVISVKRLGSLVYLKTPREALLKRVGEDQPAYLKDRTYDELIDARLASYEKNADYEITADSVEAVLALAKGDVLHGQ